MRIVKGTAVYTAAFTPPTQPLTAITGTSLLTCADNRFIDESANNFALTRNGDTRVTNWSPFKAVVQTPQTYSGYFDGTGDSLTVSSNTAFEMGSGDFTAECWFNASSNNDGGLVFKGQYQTGATWLPGFGIRRMSATQIRFYFNTSSTLAGEKFFDYTVVTNLNTWYHVAMVVSSGVGYAFVNGTLVNPPGTSGVGAIGTSATGITIGLFPFNDISLNFTGCISNVRIIKGTAAYTANFTPATAPLTAVTNTSLLTCQSPTFIDNSANRFAITAVGNSQSSTVNPFGFTFANSTGYTGAEHGGSAYFDGSGDVLTFPPSQTPLLLGNSNFTFEAWVYRVSGTGQATILAGQSDLSTVPGSSYVFYISSTGTSELYSGTTAFGITNPNVPLGAWSHVSWARTGGTFSSYLNGVRVGTRSDLGTSSVNVGSTANLTSMGNSLQGYIAGARLIKGSGVYDATQSNIAVPITPPTAVTNTTLLLNFASAAIRDATTKNVLETIGDVKISTAVSKFGGSSMFFDGTGDRLIVPSSPNFDFPGNFTIEMWINFTNVTSTWEAIISRAYAITGGWRLYKNDGTNQLSWWSVAAQVVSTTGSPLTNNTWSHVAVVRNSGTITIYIDGVNRGSAANTTNYNPGNYALEIGEGVVTSAWPFEGYIQDLRITNGVARYTANFTPPTSEFKTF